MIFTTLKGTKVAINSRHVVAVEAASDEKGVPIVGMTNVLLSLPPPNVAGAGHVSLVIRGDFRSVCNALGVGTAEFEETIPVPDEDIPF